MASKEDTLVEFPANNRYVPYRAKQGGMGVAFFCDDRLTDHKVVLKALRPDKSDTARRHTRFLQEVVDWIYLGTHPFIVQAHKVELLGNPPLPYLVLEQITGRDDQEDVSLAAKLRRRKGYPLGVSIAVKIAWQVAQAMEFATQKIPHLVHRDIKPDNIFLDMAGEVKLSDFGLAIATDITKVDFKKRQEILEKVEVESHRPAGSPHYIAPEQWQVGNVVDMRVDVYALGATLFELVTARRCVKGKALDEIRQSHLDRDLNELPEHAPKELAAIIDKCIAFSADERYQSWQALSADLAICYKSLCGEQLVAPKFDDNRAAQDLGNAYLNIANAYLNLGLLEDAFEYLNGVQANILEGDDIKLRVDFYKLKALLLSETQKHHDAGKALEGALDLIANDQWPELVIELTSMLGDQLIRANQIEKGLEKHELALNLTKVLTVDKPEDLQSLELMVYSNLATASAQQGDFCKAIEIYKEQLNLPIMSYDLVGRAMTLSNLGFAMLDNGDKQDAIAQFSRALDFAKASNDVTGQSSSLKGLCEATLQLEDTNAAQTYLTEYHQHAIRWRNKKAQQWAEAQLQQLSANAD